MHKIIFAALAVVSWVAGNLMLRVAVEYWPPVLAGMLSRLVTVSLLAVWVLSTHEGWRRLLPRGTGGWLIVMGINSILVNVLWFEAMTYTTATNVALLFRLDLVFVVLIGGLLGMERVRATLWPVLLMMLLGLALFTEAHHCDWSGHIVGDLMMVFAAFGLAANAFIIRHILHTMDVEAVALYNLGISGLGFLSLAMASGGFSLVRYVPRPLGDWLWIIGLGVVLAFSLPLYYAALRRLEVWKLRTYMLTAPLLVAAVEWLLWGLSFSPIQCLGAAMVLGGLVICIRLESRVKDIPCTLSTQTDNLERIY